MTYNLQNHNYCTVNKVITNFVSLYPMFDTILPSTTEEGGFANIISAGRHVQYHE